MTPDAKTLRRGGEDHGRTVRGSADRRAAEAGLQRPRQPDRLEAREARGDRGVRRRRRRASCSSRRGSRSRGRGGRCESRRSLALAVVLGAAFLAALSAGSARAADECKGLRVCLPVAGPWVVVPAGGIDYELACPRPGVRRRRHRRAGGDGRRRRLVPRRDGQPGRPRRDDAAQRRLPRRPRSSQGRDVELPAVHRLHPDLGWRAAGRLTAYNGARSSRRRRCSASSSTRRFVAQRRPCARRARHLRSSLGSSSAIAFRQAASPSALQRGAVQVRRSTAGRARRRARHGHGRRGHPCRGAGAGRLREGAMTWLR